MLRQPEQAAEKLRLCLHKLGLAGIGSSCVKKLKPRRIFARQDGTEEKKVSSAKDEDPATGVRPLPREPLRKKSLREAENRAPEKTDAISTACWVSPHVHPQQELNVRLSLL